MLGDAIRKLKFDRRLARRRGWVEAEDLERAVEGLPDLADNATTTEDCESPGATDGPPAS
jgi:hypothetical protein